MIHMTATEHRIDGWRAFCRCPWRSEFVATLDAARDLGDAHLAEANGQTICRDCDAPLEHLPGNGWVDARSGDEWGTYDVCPANDDGHVPKPKDDL